MSVHTHPSVEYTEQASKQASKQSNMNIISPFIVVAIAAAAFVSSGWRLNLISEKIAT